MNLGNVRCGSATIISSGVMLNASYRTATSRTLMLVPALRVELRDAFQYRPPASSSFRFCPRIYLPISYSLAADSYRQDHPQSRDDQAFRCHDRHWHRLLHVSREHRSGNRHKDSQRTRGRLRRNNTWVALRRQPPGRALKSFNFRRPCYFPDDEFRGHTVLVPPKRHDVSLDRHTGVEHSRRQTPETRGCRTH